MVVMKSKRGLPPPVFAAPVVVASVPVVHPSDEFLWYRDGEVWPGGKNVQFPVGDHGCYFDDGFFPQIEPSHLEIDPYHSVMSLVHAGCLEAKGLDSSFRLQRRQASALDDSKVRTI